METWRSRLYLMLLGSVCVAVGVVVLAIKSTAARLDMLASVSIVGGLAMFVVALVRPGGNGKDQP